jgi:hypothetical protein
MNILRESSPAAAGNIAGPVCYTATIVKARRRPWMARRLTLVKGASERGALVYGMRMFDAGEIAGVDEARVRLAGGEGARVTMHLIEGTRAQIRRQLMQSIDAFFELLDENR